MRVFDRNEAGCIPTWRGISPAVGISSGQHEERRARNKYAGMDIDVVEVFPLCQHRRLAVEGRSWEAFDLSHRFPLSSRSDIKTIICAVSHSNESQSHQETKRQRLPALADSGSAPLGVEECRKPATITGRPEILGARLLSLLGHDFVSINLKAHQRVRPKGSRKGHICHRDRKPSALVNPWRMKRASKTTTDRRDKPQTNLKNPSAHPLQVRRCHPDTLCSSVPEYSCSGRM